MSAAPSSIGEAPGLDAYLTELEGRLQAAVASHPGVVGSVGAEALAAGGKRLRPLLVFLSSDPAGEPPYAAGVAVELVHMATLVHDDLIDGAEVRRGKTSAWSEHGALAAKTVGDYLFSRAFAELARTRAPANLAILADACLSLVRGEAMQRRQLRDPDTPVEAYLERCALKTASLFEAACRLGALFGDRPELAPALANFGARVGVAFQLLDDVLDVSGPEERTGKPRGTDLLDGTVTLPLIIARRRDPELRRLDLREVVTDPAQAAAVCDQITLTGALGEARTEAFGYVAEAKASLSGLDLPEQRSKALDLVADGVVERYA